MTLVRTISQPIQSTVILLTQSLPQTPLVRFLSVRLLKPSRILRKGFKTTGVTLHPHLVHNCEFQGTYPRKK